MSIHAIAQTSFVLGTLTDQAYELKIHFSGECENPISTKKFIFKEEHTPQEECIVDIYSQNGTSAPSILAHLFEKRDEQGIKKAVQKVKAAPSAHSPSVMVLDIHDKHTQYSACSECEGVSISQCEESVCSFFEGHPTIEAGSRAKRIQAFLKKEMPLDFILCEGSLKKALLQEFEEKEITYFQSTKEGRESFCQCAEFFMNAFKLGHTAQANAYYEGSDYFKSVSDKFRSFTPCKIAETYYPTSYLSLYSPEGTFANIMKSVFSITGEIDEQKISRMQVGKKL